MAVARWRSAGNFKCPVVIRVAIGGYLTGGAIYHSQCGEVMFTHIPGLRVVMPSTALDVCGLLRTAMRSDDPVLFLEHKHLYRQPYNRSPVSRPGFHDSVRQGARGARRDGRQHHHLRCGGASRGSGRGGAWRAKAFRSRSSICARSAPTTGKPLRRTVRKTNRVIVAYEDMRSWGYGAEIAARIGDELFERTGRAGAPRGGHGHILRLPSQAGRRDSAANGRHRNCRPQPGGFLIRSLRACGASAVSALSAFRSRGPRRGALERERVERQQPCAERGECE